MTVRRQALQASAQNVHHGDLADRADVHHDDEPFTRDADRFQEVGSQEKMALVDGRVNERDDEQGEEEGLLEQF